MSKNLVLVISIFVLAACSYMQQEKNFVVPQEQCSEQARLKVSSYIETYRKNPHVIVNLTNECIERTVYVEKVVLICSGKEIGIKNFKEDFAKFLSVEPGKSLRDVVDIFRSLYNQSDIIDLICAGHSQIKLVTSGAEVFMSDIEIRTNP